MRKLAGLILLVTLIFQFTGAAGFNTSNMNPQSQVHSAHIGAGTTSLNCDACHGFPANAVQVRNGTKPGEYIVCENCHAAPPDSFKPSYGNLIVIHLSRGLYCTNCHGSDFTAVHSSVKVGANATTGTAETSKCESCHADPQNSASHLNGGKYCLDCHGSKTAGTPAAAAVPAVAATPAVIPLTSATPVSTVFQSKVDSRRGFQPKALSIHSGDTVRWINEGNIPVTIVSENLLWSADAILRVFDESFSYTFTRPGTYEFSIKELPLAERQKITVIPTLAVGTPSIIPVSPAPSPVSAEAKKRAQLQVTYEVGAGRTKQELTVSVSLKNIGNATASRINLTIENPPELQAAVLSGSEQVGNVITWKGEIEPGKEHVAQYTVKIVTGKSIEVPLKVTYAKISQEEKARELGVYSASSGEVNAALTPEEIELITLVMKIGLSAIPGFEGIMAMALVLLAVVIIRKRR